MQRIRTSPSRSAPRKRGYILVATCLSLSFLLGVCGLALDIGRMYIAQNEAQAYVDSAALAAARQLDGTSTGITRASSATGGDTDKWRFDTQSFSSVTTTFSTSSGGSFVASPSPATGYTYAKVVAVVSLPMYLMRVLTNSPTATIAASAVAGGDSITTLSSGVFPFSPYTRTWTGNDFNGNPAQPDNASDPFGYQSGNQYTLRWGAPGNNTTCGTDATKENLSDNGSIRGYCCVANSAASLRQAIVSGDTDSVTIGANLSMDTGAKNTEMSAIGDRASEDSDTTSTTYAQYQSSRTGNGARVVVVAVNSGKPNYTVLGFAAFFLLTPDSYSGLHGNDSACAEYIGAWTEGQTFPGASTPSSTGVGYKLRLVK
jgi:Flp pilus assembly protein TadG